MKGFKTIFGVLATASLLFSFNASAQENNNRDENGKIVRGAYETNRALDNTFITIAGGINSDRFRYGNRFRQVVHPERRCPFRLAWLQQ